MTGKNQKSLRAWNLYTKHSVKIGILEELRVETWNAELYSVNPEKPSKLLVFKGENWIRSLFSEELRGNVKDRLA